ncbi:hypothetical protein LX16_4682 [Stackebrandtia albiflava]|uniref:DUF1707 domain-containing protein n=2 Tax=Stackebrandtia albiflava TaxID=406432 RepID=A0A562UQK7_9ACTN|nr:hypothetical protein LX16_4682 [Stackebrandtia albiflava]
MDRQSWQVLNLYRRHLSTRLEYTYGDGRISAEQYAELHRELAEARRFAQLRRVVVRLRAATVRAERTRRWRTPRWHLERRRRRIRRQRRWWRPERFWVLGVGIAVAIGVAVLALLSAATEWLGR